MDAVVELLELFVRSPSGSSRKSEVRRRWLRRRRPMCRRGAVVVIRSLSHLHDSSHGETFLRQDSLLSSLELAVSFLSFFPGDFCEAKLTLSSVLCKKDLRKV